MCDLEYMCISIKRLKKFDEDEESFSNMDTQCEAKPSSKLNQGTGSTLSDYISSAEKGRESDLFSFSMFLSISLYIPRAVADGNTR